jgi:hypothetical protein
MSPMIAKRSLRQAKVGSLKEIVEKVGSLNWSCGGIREKRHVLD